VEEKKLGIPFRKPFSERETLREFYSQRFIERKKHGIPFLPFMKCQKQLGWQQPWNKEKS
jgi:hypothetical protein